MLKEYDDLLLREHSIVSIPKPTKRNHRTIFDWVYNNKPLVREEYQYLYDERDFLLLGNHQDEWLRSFQERIWNLGHVKFFKVKSQHSWTHWHWCEKHSDFCHQLHVPLILIQHSARMKRLIISSRSSSHWQWQRCLCCRSSCCMLLTRLVGSRLQYCCFSCWRSRWHSWPWRTQSGMKLSPPPRPMRLWLWCLWRIYLQHRVHQGE